MKTLCKFALYALITSFSFAAFADVTSNDQAKKVADIIRNFDIDSRYRVFQPEYITSEGPLSNANVSAVYAAEELNRAAVGLGRGLKACLDRQYLTTKSQVSIARCQSLISSQIESGTMTLDQAKRVTEIAAYQFKFSARSAEEIAAEKTRDPEDVRKQAELKKQNADAAAATIVGELQPILNK